MRCKCGQCWSICTLYTTLAIISSEFKENVGFTFGILETGSGLGFMLGPTIGGALYELGGFGLPFYVAGVAILLNAVAVYKFLPPVENLPQRRKGSMLTLLRSPMVVVQMGSVMVGMMGITVYDSTLAKRVEPLDFSVVMVGVIFGVVALVYSVLSTVWGYVSDTKNIQAPLIVVGHLVFGIGYLLMGPSNLMPFVPSNITTILLGLTCIGVSFGCALIPTIKCMIIGAIEMGFENNMDTYALVSGLFNSINTLGGFIGPVLGSYIVEEFGFPIGYTVVGMTSIFMMFVSLTFFTIRNLRQRRRGDKNKNLDSAETSLWMSTSSSEDFVSSYNAANRIPFTRSCSASAPSSDHSNL